MSKYLFKFPRLQWWKGSQSIGVLSQKGSVNKQVSSFLNYGAMFFAVPRALKNVDFVNKREKFQKIVK